MYKVIGAPRTRAFRVIWMLNELGQAFELVPVTPRDKVVTDINPSGKVPVLQVGSDYIIDSVAILQYLADKHGQLTFPAGTIERAHQDSFTQFAIDDVESGLWQAAKHTFVLPEDYRVPDVKRGCRFDFDRAMTTLSKRLGDRTYVMGDTFTVPDLLLKSCGDWARSIDWPIPHENVVAYMKRIHHRPAYTKTMELRNAA